MNEHLFRHHRVELEASAIDPAVAAERGYRTIGRPSGPDPRPREELDRLGIPTWSTSEDWNFPGLLIPLYGPNGQRVSSQWKPSSPVTNRDGKKMKYASEKGRPAVLDVHPRWSADRGQDDPALVPYIRDIHTPLWITEGVKKADALTSRGLCTIALSGVYNWRTTLGTLGDWEDIPLAGRHVTVCFDADAWSKPNVLRAMQRLGRWLKDAKRAAEVTYIIPPGEWGGVDTKGVDDFFAAGGTVEDLKAYASTKAPVVTILEDTFTDARMAETVADDLLAERYAWNRGLGWLGWTSRKWDDASDEAIVNDARIWSLDQFAAAADDLRARRGDKAIVDGWRSMLSSSRLRSIVGLTRGIVECKHEQFDADPEAFNSQNGILNLSSGSCRPAEPSDYVTKVAGASFHADARSQLWNDFLERILPDPEVRTFVQRLFGYAMLGVVREHVMPIFTGDGANGKGTLRDAVMAAFGDYAIEVDPEMLMGGHNPRHLTFLMELRGRRLVFCSETERGRKFAESTMKRLVGGDPIQANRMHKDPITFDPSHTLVMCTNHLPIVSGDDPAVWRRILVVPFDVVIPEEERDGHLPEKLREPAVQAAVLAWCLQGYQEYCRIGLAAPEAVKVKTKAYRSESDLIGRFLDEKVETGEACRVTSKALYEAYEAWVRGEGEDAVTKTEFGKEMTRRQYVSVKSGGQMIYRGLMVIKDDDEPAERRYS